MHDRALEHDGREREPLPIIPGPWADRPYGDVPGAAALAFRSCRLRDVVAAIGTLIGAGVLSVAVLVGLVPAIVTISGIGAWAIARETWRQIWGLK